MVLRVEGCRSGEDDDVALSASDIRIVAIRAGTLGLVDVTPLPD